MEINKKIIGKIGISIIVILFFIAKMVAFEPISISTVFFKFEMSAIFIPLGLLFGWLGVASLGIACFIAHLIKGLGVTDSIGAGASILLGAALAYFFVKKFSENKIKYFIAVWIELMVIALGLSVTAIIVRDVGFLAAIVNIFQNIWISIAIFGYLLLELVRFFAKKYKVELKIWN